jgi:hypothetical protein
VHSPSKKITSAPSSRRWFAHVRAAGAGVALLATLVAGVACSSSNASTPAAANAAPTQAAANSAVQAYVANVCKATAQLEQSAGRFVGANGGAPTGNTPTDPAAGARTIQAAATAYLDALKADNPPAELKDYNDQLVAEVQQAVGLVQNGNFGGGAGGPGANRPAGADGSPVAPANGTPRARPNGTPGAGGGPGGAGGFGGPGAGGQRSGGGIARVFLRNLPQPPANLADQLQQAAAANPDCQSTGFTFAAN